MATSIHIPPAVLQAIDRKAKALHISRNRFIVQALERELTERSQWSPGFLERLAEVDDETGASVDEMLSVVKAARRSKPPQRL